MIIIAILIIAALASSRPRRNAGGSIIRALPPVPKPVLVFGPVEEE